MAPIPGFQLIEQLHEGRNSLVYRARREHDGQPVILKMLAEAYPSPERIAWFQREYEVTRSLGEVDGIIRALDLRCSQQRWFMVLEDFGGSSLSRLMQRRRFTVEESLRLASTVAATLARLHARQVIHKDINPTNLVLNPDTGQLKVIDFGISSVLSRESTAPRAPNRLEGTLAYISPEQTGRMNRVIDFRTDFYSLGATLYEFVTGQPPFASTDPLECVHAHLARQPAAPHALHVGLDRALSDTIMRLLAKNAEDRYQSCHGLLRDLEECERRRRESLTTPFTVGLQDVSDCFRLPQKLYGREPEKQELLAAFERVATGASELVLVRGYSGIGKSALVREVHKPITRQRGYVISGKFDQLTRDEPYAPLVHAFQGLIRQLLSESQESIARWRGRICEALGPNGRVITDVIPELEVILGPQPPVPDVEPGEARNRFLVTFQGFIRALAGEKHPLVLFIDDLQWVDGASLALLQALMADGDSSHLLLIGAYRDNEVSDTHPLMLSVEQLRKAGVALREIALGPLGVEHVAQLVQDAFACTPADALPLAGLAHAKTGGNPFFLGEFLKHLVAERLIRFEPAHGWRWSLEQISAARVTDNVVVFMSERVRKLPPECQRALQLAACMGNVFDLRTLATVMERSAREAAAALWEALAEGLVVPLDDTYKLTGVDVENLFDTVDVQYRFMHDRIQQAAYSLLEGEQKGRIHWKLGQLLWKGTPSEALGQRLFDIVHQLGHGLEHARERGERDALAKLYLQAGRKAKASAAHEPALRYLRTGLLLLAGPGTDGASLPPPEALRECWERQYRLSLDLFDEAAEAACLCGEYEEMQRLLQVVLTHAVCVLDKVRSFKTEIQSYSARKELLAGVEAGRRALALFGIDIPASPDLAAMAPAAAAAAETWAGRDIEALLSLPEMEDPEKLAAMELLARLYIPAYNSAPGVFALVVYHEVILSLRHGLTWTSSRGLVAYAFLLCVQGDIESGYRFGKLALRVAERFQGRDLSSTRFMFNFFVRYWRESVKEPEPFLEGYRVGLESGEQEFAALNFCGALCQPFWSGAGLPALAANAASYDRTLRQLKQEWPREVNGIHWQSILNLLGASADPCALVGEVFDERENVPRFLQSNSIVALALFHLNKLALCSLLGEPEKALEHAREAEKYMGALTIAVFMMAYRFHDALASLACASASGEERRAELLARADADLALLRTWALHAPGNLAQKVALVEAERARVMGQAGEARQLYDEAISLAQKHGFVWDEALAHELAARFHRERGHPHLARHYIRDAHYAYQRWGAAAKVGQLAANFRHELAHVGPPSRGGLGAEGTAVEEFVGASSLDLRTVLKASQALSGELALDKLLTRLLKTVLENAGAQKALLIMEKEGQLVIEAEGSADGSRMRVLQSAPVAASEELPSALVQMVARGRRAEVLSDASAEGLFTEEPYVRRQRARSILCMPLINQGRLTALLYLENNLVSGAFTHERIELLNLLSGEMAIAIDQARLYQALELANKELALVNQTLEEKVTARTRELADKNQELQQALTQLTEAQRMLVLREKMASLGRLAAGVAHELRNPLNFIINFAELSRHLSVDATEEVEAWRQAPDPERVDDVKQLLSDMARYAERISEHGKRANGIIGSMLTHSLASSTRRAVTDVNELLGQSVLLMNQSLATRETPFKVGFIESYDARIGKVELMTQELGRVFINLFENACYSAEQKRRKLGEGYSPEIQVRTVNRDEAIEIVIRDNGLGIAKENLDQVFQPFFTTKPPREGTGLGLSICYDIVVHKHQGDLRVTSQEGEYAEFTIILPKRV